VKFVTYTLPETEMKPPYYILWNSGQYIRRKSFSWNISRYVNIYLNTLFSWFANNKFAPAIH
jgi:hypothetical protein